MKEELEGDPLCCRVKKASIIGKIQQTFIRGAHQTRALDLVQEGGKVNFGARCVLIQIRGDGCKLIAQGASN